MIDSVWFWVVFHLFILGMVYVDLKVFHRNPTKSNLKSSLLCCLFWVGLALAFNGLVWWSLGSKSALTFLTAYLLESSLSIDNLFLFLVVFAFCQIKTTYQHKVLFLGILGALVFRLLFIVLGISLLEKFEWMYIVFGAFLCFSAACFFFQKDSKKDLSQSLLVKVANSLFRVDHGNHKGRFFIKKKGKLYVTMLFLSLFIIEVSDIVFAVDSVPAVLAITSNLFLAYTSNVFAVLGLRSFYFLLARLKDQFANLKTGIALILFFVGTKLILIPYYKIPTIWTFLFIFLSLSISVVLSFFFCKKK
jgi:tellurite resistance protein TerC